jgi:hypothetical protein
VDNTAPAGKAGSRSRSLTRAAVGATRVYPASMGDPPETPPTAPPPQLPYGSPYAYPPARPTNGLAIGSLVTSIAAFFVCGSIGIVGAIMGHMARRQLRERNEDGDGLALAGIIVGWIGFALSLVMILALGAFIAINFMGVPQQLIR